MVREGDMHKSILLVGISNARWDSAGELRSHRNDERSIIRVVVGVKSATGPSERTERDIPSPPD